MPMQPPSWQTNLLERHKLPGVYLEYAQKWFAPLAGSFARHQNGAGRPLLLALNGTQGSGKTTLCDYLCSVLGEEYALRAVSLSLDDFYLTRAERMELASRVHPLLATRGVPGTHDMALLQGTLDKLRTAGEFAIPRFDKSRDDRCGDWYRVQGPVDIILLEGWCLGAQAESAEALATPVNDLERDEDPAGIWRGYVNQFLADNFPPLYAQVDQWIMLRAPSFDCVYRWRLEQEQKLVTGADSDATAVMGEREVARFIQYFQRLTLNCMAQLPQRVHHLFTLDSRRLVTGYRRPREWQP